jgi:hypothetical protein
MKTQWKTVIALAIAATTFTAQANEAHHQDASAAVVTKKAAKPAAKPMAASKEIKKRWKSDGKNECSTRQNGRCQNA